MNSSIIFDEFYINLSLLLIFTPDKRPAGLPYNW